MDSGQCVWWSAYSISAPYLGLRLIILNTVHLSPYQGPSSAAPNSSIIINTVTGRCLSNGTAMGLVTAVLLPCNENDAQQVCFSRACASYSLDAIHHVYFAISLLCLTGSRGFSPQVLTL